MKRFFWLTAVWCCLISTVYAAVCAPVTRNFLVSGLGEPMAQPITSSASA